jgi:hypothetical protein
MTSISHLYDAKRSLLFYIFFGLSLAGIGVLFSYDVPQSKVILPLVLVASNLFLFAFLFIRENKEKTLEYPFAETTHESAMWLWVGILIFVIINFMFYVTGLGFRTFDIIRPFFIWTSNIQSLPPQLTITAIQINIEPFWGTFWTVIVAGVQETFIFNFVAVLIGQLLGWLVTEFFEIKNKKTSLLVRFVIALAFSTAAFMYSHNFNETYTSAGMFIAAGIFMTLTNIIVYYFLPVVMLIVGMHMSNNAAAQGYGKTLSELFNMHVPILQIPLIILLIGTLIYVLSKPSLIIKHFMKIKPDL